VKFKLIYIQEVVKQKWTGQPYTVVRRL